MLHAIVNFCCWRFPWENITFCPLTWDHPQQLQLINMDMNQKYCYCNSMMVCAGGCDLGKALGFSMHQCCWYCPLLLVVTHPTLPQSPSPASLFPFQSMIFEIGTFLVWQTLVALLKCVGRFWSFLPQSSLQCFLAACTSRTCVPLAQDLLRFEALHAVISGDNYCNYSLFPIKAGLNNPM